MDKVIPLTGKGVTENDRLELQQRSAVCAEEIDQVLKKHKCKLSALFQCMPPGPMVSEIKVIPVKDEKEIKPQ